MDFLAGLWVGIGLIYAATCVIRPIIRAKRFTEHENGLALGAETSEELMEWMKKLRCSFIKEVYYNEEGNVEIVGKAGKHKFYLEDGVVKAEELLASDRKDYKRIVEECAIFDLLAKEKDHNLPINPYVKYKRGIGVAKWNLITSIAWIVLTIVIFGVLLLVHLEDERINMVKNATPEAYTDITFGEAYEYFFTNPEWEYFVSDDGADIVEFTGNCYYFEEEADVLIQFELDVEEEMFKVRYLEIDEESQDWIVVTSMLEKIFSEYEGVD